MTAGEESSAPRAEVLRYEVEDGIATITLDRPDVLNSFDRALKEALLKALGRVARDDDARVVILTGAGRAFSAGQDLRERTDSTQPDLSVELRDRYNPIILAMRRHEKPIVGAINGVAAGAGFSLALACDLLVAAEGATFIQAFGRVGLVPDTGSTWFLPRLVGYHRAAEIVMTTDPVDARTAERLGFVNRVVPGERLMEETRSLAARLAASAPIALGLAKRALNVALESDLAAALEYEAQLQAVAGRSDDHREATAAFVEKRPARFTGR